MNTSAEYIPGTCNIGPKELKNRKNTALITAILTVAVIILLLVFHADKTWRLVLFIPAASMGVSFLQWYNKFCVNFGLRGVFNFGDMGKTFTVEQKEDYSKDRAKAWRMIITGIILGLILAIAFYFLPVQ
jgi:uncharacterized integral membrane protein